MVIDVHGHVVAPPELYLYKEFLQGTRGSYGQGVSGLGRAYGRTPNVTDERAEEFAREHIKWLDEVGTDMQLISARPYGLMHSEKPSKIVYWWAQAVNNFIGQQCRMFPNRLAGMVNMPQAAGEPISNVFEEVERCVKDMGFVGVLLNPDPSEGEETTPPLSDEYWFPLYEKMVALDLPGLIHSTACKNRREPQSLHFITEESRAVLNLVDGQVFDIFPKLKIIVCHGGGSIPYQMGRFRGVYWTHRGIPGTFDEQVRRMWFDTSLYTTESVELLLKVIGPDRCLLGTERPGDGTAKDPETGRAVDDVRSVIEEFQWISAPDKKKVLEDNARSLFSRLKITA